MQHRLFEPIISVVYDTMPRDNLLNSACLELFEYIKREGVKQIIVHLAENYREKLLGITYVDTFHQLIHKYEQLQAGYNPVGEDTSFSTQGADTPNRGLINGGQRWQGLKDTDEAEEAYFNTSDGEEEDDMSLPTAATAKPLTNRASPIRPLVAYPDDEEDGVEATSSSPSQRLANQENQAPTPSPERAELEPSRGRNRTPVALSGSPGVQSPPERPSEKRRREEDEDDDLGKIASGVTATKRRNSVSSNTSATSKSSGAGGESNGAGPTTPVKDTNGPALRRKGSLRSKDSVAGHHRAGSTGGISISLGVKTPSGGDSGNS